MIRDETLLRNYLVSITLTLQKGTTINLIVLLIGAIRPRVTAT
ncbi:Uncharacterised protein [Lederbergia lenta]|uniref:Uncharacterized protein n=1 Tax=Lederbergia lenta TaxID=1467 RepID=A0A2X4W1U3_LEDLE|nr:Uncharacterised protein [Lederbergia lenta]